MSLSRRDFIASSAVALGAGVLGRPALTRAWQRQAPAVAPVFTDIRRNVGFFTGRGGTIGYLINAGGVVVVDSQFPDAAKLCVAGINEQGDGFFIPNDLVASPLADEGIDEFVCAKPPR